MIEANSRCSQAEEQVRGFPNAAFKKFDSWEEAAMFIQEYSGTDVQKHE